MATPPPSSRKTKRTEEGWAKCYARSSATKRRLREDPEYRAGDNAKARASYHANKDKYQKVSRDWRRKNKELLSEQRKEHRNQNRELARANDAKWRANSIKSTLTKFRRGDISIGELNRRISETFLRADERYRNKIRERGFRRDGGGGSGKADREPSSWET